MPSVASDIQKRIGDGLPETLPEWINYNGLTHIKIKLNGEDIKWDTDRVLRVGLKPGAAASNGIIRSTSMKNARTSTTSSR